MTFLSDLNAAASRLDDFEVGVNKIGEIEVRRGAQSTRAYYWTFQDGRIVGAERITDLPNLTLRPDALSFYMAQMSQGAFEDRITGETLFAGVRKSSAAHLTRIDSATGAARQNLVYQSAEQYLESTPDTLAHRLKDLLMETARELLNDAEEIWLETSGGIDSTLIGAIIRAVKPDRFRINSLSLIYPYYEFRREHQFIDCATQWLDSHQSVLDGAGCLSFSHLEMDQCFSEPSLVMAGLAQQLQILRAANRPGALLLNGNGGANLFDLGPWQQPRFTAPTRCFDWMSDAFYSDFTRHHAIHRAYYVEQPDIDDRIFLSGGNIDDRWTERELASQIGLRRSHLFLHPEIPAIIHALWEKRENNLPGKWILIRYFRDLIPEMILLRPRKVAYNGLYCRAYRAAYQPLTNLVRKYSDHLEAIGIMPPALQAHICTLRDGKLEGDTEVSVVLTYLLWLESWKNTGRALI